MSSTTRRNDIRFTLLVTVVVIVVNYASSFSVVRRTIRPPLLCRQSQVPTTSPLVRIFSTPTDVDSDDDKEQPVPAAAAADGQKQKKTQFDAKQLDFTMGYLNKHHRDLLMSLAIVFTDVGAIKAKKNAFSGGSYKVLDAQIIGLDENSITLDVTVKDRRETENQVEMVKLSLDADPIKAMQREYQTLPKIPPPASSSSESDSAYNPIDDFVRKMNRLCNIVHQPHVTGKLIQLGIQIGGDGIGELKENLYLNQVPHNRYVRKYFYDLSAKAVLDAVILCSQGKISNRMKMVNMFPELNPSMDSYRIGTILELARTIAITLAEQNLRVRVCVQGTMGVGIFTGIPKQLNGVSTLLQRMDWQSNEGEENEGMVGNYVNFGGIGKDHVVNAQTDADGNRVVEQDDVFLLICPQSMVGLECSIIGPLSEMVDAAGDRPIILLNPDLTDKVSSQGQQSVRGRQQRIDFANTFETIYHFQNIYRSGTSYFPILGAITKFGPMEPWVAHQRRDRVNDGGEVYVPVVSSEMQPDGEVILSTFD